MVAKKRVVNDVVAVDLQFFRSLRVEVGDGPADPRVDRLATIPFEATVRFQGAMFVRCYNGFAVLLMVKIKVATLRLPLLILNMVFSRAYVGMVQELHFVGTEEATPNNNRVLLHVPNF